MDLFIQKTDGRYVKATNSQVCDVAKDIVFSKANTERPTLSEPAIAKDMLLNMCGLDHEQFGVMLVDTRMRIIKVQIMFTGTIDQTAMHPREIVKLALDEGAAKVLLFHCHPSGVPTPSEPDIIMTKHVKEALELFNISLIDHMIAAGEKVISFDERGML